MDDDLDEMLLAVTDKSKNVSKKEYSSDSGAGDSDYESEDSARDDYDDGDDDEPDDEDDDDYSVGAKRKKKKPARPAAKKARTTKKPGAKRNYKKKAPARERAKLNLDDLDDDDDEEFQFQYDEQGYGDYADRTRLMQMTEVERETELEDRIRRRAQKKELWEIGRKIQKRDRGPGYSGELGARRSGRSRVNTKIAAMDDMLYNDKANKSKLADLSDADDEPDRRRSRDNPMRESPRARDRTDRDRASSPKRDAAPKQDRGRELMYSDLVKDSGANITTTLLFARRDALMMLTQRPGFARAVEGLFVRVRVSGPGNAYLLCRIAGVETGKVYKVQGTVRTDYFLILQSGGQKRTFSIEWCSGSHPTRHEFETYRSRLLQSGNHLPTRDELHLIFKKAESFIVNKNPRVTEQERREHREHHERLYPEQVNWTVKRTDVQMALDVLQQDYEVELRNGKKPGKADRMKAEVEKLTADLTKCQAMEAKYVRKDASSNAKIFQELAAKNRAENRRMDRLAHTHKKLTAGSGNSGKINPYARFETTGMSYYSVGNDARKESKPSMAELKNDWRSSLKTWKYGDTKRTINVCGKAVVQKQFDTPVAGLDDLVWPPTKDMLEVQVKKYSSMDAVYVRALRKKKRMEMRNQGQNGKDRKDEEKKTITFEKWTELRNDMN